jgi:hypothetical protein
MISTSAAPPKDERVRELEQAHGNAGQRTIPYNKPAVDSYQNLESDNAPRKSELVIATAGGRGSPKNRPGKRNKLGKMWTEGDVLNAVYGKSVDFNTALHEQALERAYELKGKLRVAVKMLELREATSP